MWVCPYGLRCVLPQPALFLTFKVAALISLVCCARALGLAFGIWAFGFGRLGVFKLSDYLACLLCFANLFECSKFVF